MRVDAILCADLHLREKPPVARLDDYLETQARKFAWLRDLQREHGGVPVLAAGDIFDKPRPSLDLVCRAFALLPEPMICVAGQHDLPNHSPDLIDKSALGLLSRAGRVQLLHPSMGQVMDCGAFEVRGFAWEEPLAGTRRANRKPRVAMAHVFCYKGKPPFPGADEFGWNSQDLLHEMNHYDLVLTGDHHQTFTDKLSAERRWLVNPGSMMRMTADQQNHEPQVFLWDAELNLIKAVPVPIESDVLSREHLDDREERQDRMGAFIERLRHDVETGLSFEQNLREYLAQNNEAISPEIQALIWESVEEK